MSEPLVSELAAWYAVIDKANLVIESANAGIDNVIPRHYLAAEVEKMAADLQAAAATLRAQHPTPDWRTGANR